MARGRNLLLLVMAVTPIVIAPLVIGGVYLGYYVGDAVGYSRAILAIAFSTAGFLVAVLILVRVIRVLVARDVQPSH